MKILVKIPTKRREKNFFSTLNKFYELSKDKENTHYLITLDNDDEVMNTDAVKVKLNSYSNLTYYYNNSISKLYASNRDLNKFTEWDILLLASDDTVPIKKGWDSIIRENMIKYYPDTDGTLHFNDGFQGNKLNTFPIVGRKYFNRFGYIQFPGYKSCFADNEFQEVSKMLNKVTYFEEVIIEHQHPDWGFGERDLHHQANVTNYAYDCGLFEQRRAINFDIKL